MNAPFHPARLNGCSLERWGTLGPYYAMFPIEFARRVIREFTGPDDAVLDPFSGRGTSVFCAMEKGRYGLGVELNPLGWIYGKAKLNPGRPELVVVRLGQIASSAPNFAAEADELPEFFHVCFCPQVRSFLVAARSMLDWRNSRIDRTLMAFILVYLHGKIGGGRPQSLSNQMRQTKAMAPDYSVAWWRQNGFAVPPEVDPRDFLRTRIQWRYQKGFPRADEALADIRLGDCRTVLPRLRRQVADGGFSLLLTSPPYCGVTSYYYDQWLRFWLLGEAAHPIRDGAEWKGKFEGQAAYRDMLGSSFTAARRVMQDNSAVYVRTDARPTTLEATKEALREAFPEWTLKVHSAPFLGKTQTQLFGDKGLKPGEVDLILTR